LDWFWLAFWYATYAPPAAKLASGHLGTAEYAYIHSDADEQADPAAVNVPWARLIGVSPDLGLCARQVPDRSGLVVLSLLAAGIPQGENARKVSAYLAAHPHYAGSQADLPGVISWPLAVAVVYTFATARLHFWRLACRRNSSTTG